MNFRYLCCISVFLALVGVSISFKHFSVFSRIPGNDNKRPTDNILNEILEVRSISSCISYCKLDCTEIFFNELTKTCVLSKPVGISQTISSLGYIHMTSSFSSSAEWRIYGKSQYLPVYTSKAWINAQIDCLKNGSKLTEIETAEEYHFVKNIAGEINAANIHIGGTDAFEEGHMVWWSSLQSVDLGLSLWTPNQPDNYNNNEHCMNLQKSADYKLNDGSCQSALPFICERSV